MLNVCHQVFIPIDDSRLSQCRRKEFEEFLFRTECADILERVHYVTLPKEETQDTEDSLDALFRGFYDTHARKLVDDQS
jgi:hypothetical protein